MIPAYVLSKDAEECADQTDDQQQSDAGNGLPVLLLHQEEQAEGQSQRNQLGQNAIQNALDNDGAVAVLDDGSNGGAAVVGSQSTDDEDAQHGSCTGELLSVGSQDVDSLGAQVVRPVHQEEAACELHDVKDQQEHDRTSKRTVDGHVRCDTCGDRNQSEPEDCVADTAQRTHSGNTHGTNGFDVSLLLLQREDDAHNEGNEEGVSIEELKGYEELKAEKPDAMRPVFVIGSEVPIPGGATEAEDTLAVTKPEAFRDTVSTYQRVWTEEGVGEGMKDVIAVVVQPGVEFGDEQVFDYNPAAAVDLCAALKEFPDICFEGHSTDYQTATDLYNMVTDGIAILKVGPALTFGLREALFSLSMMEKELVPEEKRANFIETLDQVMLASPANWEKHYHGDEKHLAQCRKYSYSDRARYYIGQPEVVAAMNKLFDNLREYPIPMNMLHQYMPISYAKIREGQLKLDPRELAMDGIVQFMLDYESAV